MDKRGLTIYLFRKVGLTKAPLGRRGGGVIFNKEMSIDWLKGPAWFLPYTIRMYLPEVRVGNGSVCGWQSPAILGGLLFLGDHYSWRTIFPGGP